MSKKAFFSAVVAGIMVFGFNAAAESTGGGAGHGSQRIVMEANTNHGTLELHFADAQRVSFYDASTLQITRADGTTWKYRPSLSQDVNGKRKYLVPEFRILGRDRVGLSVTKADTSAPVLLDGKSPNS